MSTQYPAYLNLLENGELRKRAQITREILSNCTLCPWNCKVDRLSGEIGECRTGALARVYSYMPHHGEEDPLRGRRGSGTIFFSGCNLHCQFCQNADISQENYGMETGAEKLAGMMLDLQARGCHNINLVSPTHVPPQILDALLIAARKGLALPLVYNTGGYDKVSSLRLLGGIVDIYMPDMKYADARAGRKYSGVKNYPAINRDAVLEMHRQVGDLKIDEKGIAMRGLLIRHLVLPNDIAGTEAIVKFIAEEISRDTYLNLMAQYRPEYHISRYPQMNRRITREEFNRAVTLAREAGLGRLD